MGSRVCWEKTHSKVLHLVGDLVQHFVLAHAVLVVVAPEADHDEAVFLAEDGLVDVPACSKMRENDGTHGRTRDSQPRSSRKM